MLKLASRTLYGISAVFELACRHGQGPVRVEDIANKQNIPRNYLDQILLELKKSGITQSHRGSKGGYTLARSPDEITIWEVIQVMQGTVNLAAAASLNSTVLESYWNERSEEFKTIFQNTFQELVDRWKKHKGKLNYSI